MKSRLNQFILLAVVVVILLQIFFQLGARQNEKLFYEQYVLKIFRPIGSFFIGLSHSLSSTLDKYFYLVEAQEKNQNLLAESQFLKIQNYVLKAKLDRANQTAAAGKKYHFSDESLLPAKIIAEELFLPAQTILINVGALDGVRVGQPVLEGQGLVGKILKVYHRTSQVLLVCDPNFSVDGMSQQTGIRLLVTGVSQNRLLGSRYPFLTRPEFLEQAVELQKGDAILTSGFGSAFPEKIPIGSVQKVKFSDQVFESTVIVPSVDFAKLSHVYVLLD